MDLGMHLSELSAQFYLQMAGELNRRKIPPSLGKLVAESVYRRFCEDALSAAICHCNTLEKQMNKNDKKEGDNA